MATYSAQTLTAHAVGVLAFLATAPGHAGTSMGTGFAVTFDGIIVTNNHVIRDCSSQIKARNEGNASYYYEAVVIASDARRDLAALKLQRPIGRDYQGPVKDVPRAILRQAPALQQGEKAITYGFPLRGLLATNGNLTVGYVSA